MPPAGGIPDPLEKILPGLGTNAEGLLAAESTDLDMDGRFVEEWILVSSDTVWIVALEGETFRTRWQKSLSDIESFSVLPAVGNGFLQAKISGEECKILRYSNLHSGQFAQTAKSLTAFIKDGKLPGTVKESDTACSRCGTAFLENSRVCPRCMSKTKVLLRLVGYARRYRFLAYAIALLMIGGTVLRFAAPVILREIIGKVLLVEEGSTIDQRLHLLLILVLLLAASNAVSTLFRIAHARISASIGARMVFDLRAEAYTNLQRLSLSFYDKQQVGALMSRVTSDTEMIHHFVVDGIQYIFINLLTLLLIAALMFWANYRLAVLALVTAPIVIYCTRIFTKKLMILFHKYFDHRSRFHAVVNDTLSGIRVVKAFAGEDREIDRYRVRNESFRDAGVTLEKSFGTFFPSLQFISTIGTVIVWLVGGYYVIEQELGVNTFIMFLYLLGMLQGPLDGLSRIHHWISSSCAATERVFEITDAEPDIKDPETPIDVSNIKGAVSFNHVTFGYDRYNPVLKGVDFHIRSGEMVGLVGHSGAGKTTAINLLCRFYDPDEGSITVDGIDLRDMARSQYGGKIGVVLQEQFLFNGTIWENIAYAKPDAVHEEIITAAKTANAHDFIIQKPDGYDSQVGEGGTLLSVGEKQRISIARAILHDPVILILDEATASVDTETERQIQEALGRLVAGRTTIAIAHRLSTLRLADRLVVFKDGEVIECGTHDELVKKGGEYYDLVELQSEMGRMRTVGG